MDTSNYSSGKWAIECFWTPEGRVFAEDELALAGQGRMRHSQPGDGLNTVHRGGSDLK